MSKKVVGLFVVVAFLLASCASIADAAGYVPKAKLDEANAKNTVLTTERDQAKTDLGKANARIGELQGQLDKAKTDLGDANTQLNATRSDLADWQGILCPHSWNEITNEAWGWFPLTAYSQVPEDLAALLFTTQWQKEGPYDENKPLSVMLVDQEDPKSMDIDIVKNCVILNPAVFPFLGK